MTSSPSLITASSLPPAGGASAIRRTVRPSNACPGWPAVTKTGEFSIGTFAEFTPGTHTTATGGRCAGKKADVGSLIPAIDRLHRRFRINRVLDDPAPFVPFALMKERREVDYEAKAVKLAARRYIVCRNLDEMSKDAANRATTVAALERQLKKGDRASSATRATAVSSRTQGRRLRHRPRQGRGGRKSRRRVRVADQRETLAAGGDARLQTTLYSGTTLPHDKRSAQDAADLSQTRRDDPLPRRLQFPRARAQDERRML
jgi:hypothetical protein